MFENLQERLEGAFKTLKGQGKITEINVAETIKEIRRALVDADVNYKIAKEFTDRVKEKALGQNVLTAVSPGQLITKIMSDELTELMGGTAADFNVKGAPAVILIAGLQGSGKTTFTHKLALFLKTQKFKRPLMVACDVYRPAAIDQLMVLGEKINIPVYADKESNNPLAIALKGIEEAKANGNDVVIIDTAGRLAVDEDMMNEIIVVEGKNFSNRDFVCSRFHDRSGCSEYGQSLQRSFEL
jgi:signal recognition particle subunit SRP54